MNKQQISTSNGQIESVTVQALYLSSRKVPRIGQRKNFGQNGAVANLVLHNLEVTRYGVYDESKHLHFEFRTKEYWTGYYEF